MWEIAGVPSIERVSAALRDRRSLPDRMFDYYLPKALRSVSSQHWTPLVASMRGAEWLTDFGIDSVVDVGAGVGKFCISAALACSARFLGIEQRPELVAEASRLARTFGVDDRVSFMCRTFERGALPEAEAYYLYNPFGENLLSHEMRIDSRVELSADRHLRDSRAFEDMLWALREGTYVITYNGFGGCMPESYEEVRTDRSLPSVLSLWRKHR
jgi:predicted RNA methylase